MKTNQTRKFEEGTSAFSSRTGSTMYVLAFLVWAILRLGVYG